jgi:hypothetical protein
MSHIESRESAGTSRAPSPASSSERRQPRTRKASRPRERRGSVTGQNAISRRLVFLFAVAGGAAVGNLYWSQPLLDLIATGLKAGTDSAGWLVTAIQIGYAIGVLLFVPLGDVLNRRILVPVALLCATAALLASALAPTFTVLLVALFLVGLTTVSGQILVPLAGDLASDSDRGRVVGSVVSGILIGIWSPAPCRDSSPERLAGEPSTSWPPRWHLFSRPCSSSQFPTSRRALRSATRHGSAPSSQS